MRRRTEDYPGFTPDSQMALFWRILHLMLARYGNHPMGQLLVALTMVFLNERGLPPTLTDLCRATGLPKSSVSRYVAWQITHGMAKETVDPNDRRKRYLVQTPKGRTEWHWQVAELKRVFTEISALDRQLYQSGGKRDAQALLERMAALTNEAPTRSAKFPPGKKRAASKASHSLKS